MEQNEVTLPAVAEQSTSAFSLVMNDGAMDRMLSAAKMMASAKVTIPKHLQNSEGDCMAIIMQAAQWKMNPFAVAQKTHIVNGTLGYEAQLVNAVIQGSGAITGRFHYEYRGEGNNLECRTGAIIRGETEITWGEWIKNSDVTTRNSPLWKTNPRQQLGYLQVKNWARAYSPGAILGVYSEDELEHFPAEKEINPTRPPRQTGTQAAEAAKQQSAAQFDPAERAELVGNLEKIAAEYGIEAYAETWSKLEPLQRKMVGADEHARLKTVAASIAAESVDTETGEVTNHE